MKQDVMTALREMGNQSIFLGIWVAKLVANLCMCVIAILMLGAVVWLFVHAFLVGMGLLTIVFTGFWFHIEYKAAKATREWYEMCQVNKGETK